MSPSLQVGLKKLIKANKDQEAKVGLRRLRSAGLKIHMSLGTMLSINKQDRLESFVSELPALLLETCGSLILSLISPLFQKKVFIYCAPGLSCFLWIFTLQHVGIQFPDQGLIPGLGSRKS